MAGTLRTLDRVDLSQYEFIDFGASQGGSLDWATKVYGGPGIGIDIDPAKVAKLVSRGFDGMVADASDLQLPAGCVRYATLSHFLEHLPDIATATAVVAQAMRVARDFVLIVGPNFEKEGWLRTQGLKRYYADWSGHKFLHKIGDFEKILKEIGASRYSIWEHGQMTDSNSWVLVPRDAPKNSGPYDPAQHGAKPFVKIPEKLFSTINVCILKSPAVNAWELMFKSSNITMRRWAPQEFVNRPAKFPSPIAAQ